MANAISHINSYLIDEIRNHYANDNAYTSPYENLSKESRFIEEIEHFESYDLRVGFLYYNVKVCIPSWELQTRY